MTPITRTLTHRQRGLLRIEIGGRIRQNGLGRVRRVVEDDLEPVAARHILQHGNVQLDPAAARRDVALPAGPDQRVALLHQMAVAGIVRGGGIVLIAVSQDVVEQRRAVVVAAVDDGEEDPLVGLREIDGTQDHDIGRRSHQSGRVGRREIDVDDSRVVRVLRVGCHCRAADQLLVLTDSSEDAAAECGRFDANDFESHDFGAGGGCDENDEHRGEGTEQHSHRCLPARQFLQAGLKACTTSIIEVTHPTSRDFKARRRSPRTILQAPGRSRP